MNLNLKSVRTSIENFFADPVRRYYFFWAAVYAGILALGCVVATMSWNRASQIKASAAGVKSQLMAKGVLSGIGSRDDLAKQMMSRSRFGLKQFITENEIPVILSNISKEAGTNALNLKKINTLPLEAAGDTLYNRVPISVEVEGNYFKIGELVRFISEDLPWFSSWQKVSMKSPQTDGNLTAEMQVDFYSRK